MITESRDGGDGNPSGVVVNGTYFPTRTIRVSNTATEVMNCFAVFIACSQSFMPSRSMRVDSLEAVGAGFKSRAMVIVNCEFVSAIHDVKAHGQDEYADAEKNHECEQ